MLYNYGFNCSGSFSVVIADDSVEVSLLEPEIITSISEPCIEIEEQLLEVEIYECII